MDDNEKSLTIEQINNLTGTVLLEFGAKWCSICQAAQPHIMNVLAIFPNIKHIKIEDGPGKKLGRHFKVKLWPTLILLQDGLEISKIVRPNNESEIHSFLSQKE